MYSGKNYVYFLFVLCIFLYQTNEQKTSFCPLYIIFPPGNCGSNAHENNIHIHIYMVQSTKYKITLRVENCFKNRIDNELFFSIVSVMQIYRKMIGSRICMQ